MFSRWSLKVLIGFTRFTLTGLSANYIRISIQIHVLHSDKFTRHIKMSKGVFHHPSLLYPFGDYKLDGRVGIFLVTVRGTAVKKF